MIVGPRDIGLESLDALVGVDSLCLFVAKDERPLRGAAGFVDWRLCGGLSRVLSQEFFRGDPEEWLLLPTRGRLPIPRIFIGGVGLRGALTAHQVGSALSGAAKTLNKARAKAVALEIPGAGVLDDAARADALTRHFLTAFGGERVEVLSEKALAKLVPAIAGRSVGSAAGSA